MRYYSIIYNNENILPLECVRLLEEFSLGRIQPKILPKKLKDYRANKSLNSLNAIDSSLV
ncbi:hypothetical protein [Helicobacter sp.]|uniref:hypothetical protein n=1 Tax=Helicobacter sp. TaxID=218 RepID=UPI0025BDCD50|nr:hypothetical protein [Helicobacter sp.]MBR2495093.1 hypothetical protein [Helicobacter sp.]